nr:hypothetical protein [Tanacetum cinerariifolium]GEX25978.1 hypothetical protein [Tanacetum cinerariifolium]
MLESKAYKEYYAFATGAVPPKAKTTYKKKDKEPVTSKTAYESVSKGPRLKTQAKMKQPLKKTKAKGLTMLIKVALSEADQMKLATKKSKKDYHISHASGSGNTDAEMTDADLETAKQYFYQEEEDTHVTLTHVHDAMKADEPLQSSSVSSDFTSKFLNLENPAPTNTKIVSLMKTFVSQDTITPTPPTPFTHVTQHQQTPTLPTTTSTTIPELPDFAFIFKFDQRVSALEIELSKLKETNQFAEAISSIPGIVDKYLASKMKEAVDVDTTMKSIIKDQVKAQVSKIMPKLEKYVTESLRAEVLVRSTNQFQTAYAIAASLSELELKKILLDKMEANKSIERSDTQMTLYNALVASFNFDKDIISSYRDVVLLKRGHDDKDKDQDPSTGSDQRMKRQRIGETDEQPDDKKATKADWFKKPGRPLTPDSD